MYVCVQESIVLHSMFHAKKHTHTIKIFELILFDDIFTTTIIKYGKSPETISKPKEKTKKIQKYYFMPFVVQFCLHKLQALQAIIFINNGPLTFWC